MKNKLYKIRNALSIILIILTIIIIIILTSIYIKNNKNINVYEQFDNVDIVILNIIKEQKEKNYNTYIKKVFDLGILNIDNKYINLNSYYNLYDNLHKTT